MLGCQYFRDEPVMGNKCDIGRRENPKERNG